MNDLRTLISTIQINKANFDNISEYNRINGTLLVEIERVCHEWSNSLETELAALKEQVEYWQNAYHNSTDRERTLEQYIEDFERDFKEDKKYEGR